MASFEERMYELGAAELAEQERQVSEIRGRPPALLAAGALVPTLLAKEVFSGTRLHGWALGWSVFGLIGGVVLLIATALILAPYEMGFSLDASFTYRWMFREGVLDQPGVDLVLADALHERREQNRKMVERMTSCLIVAIAALAVEAIGFGVAAAVAS